MIHSKEFDSAYELGAYCNLHKITKDKIISITEAYIDYCGTEYTLFWED